MIRKAMVQGRSSEVQRIIFKINSFQFYIKI